MFVGQVLAHPYASSMFFSSAGPQLSVASKKMSSSRYDRVDIKTCSQANAAEVQLMDQLMDSLDALIDRNQEFVKTNPWMSGTIRTDYINRESVYNAFQSAISNA